MGIRGALVILILVCALVPLNLSVKSQGPVIPQSPVDPTVNPQENLLSEAEKAAAFTALMDQGNMQAIGKSVGMDDPKNEWTEKKKHITKDGGVTNFRLGQVYQGLKVHRGDLTVRYQDGSNAPDLTTLHLEYLDDPQVDTNPKLNKGKAIQIAKQLARDAVNQLGGPAKQNKSKDEPNKKDALAEVASVDDATLEVHPGAGKGKRRLSWHASVKDESVKGPVQIEAWIDQDGNVLEAHDNIQSYVLAGTGRTGYQGTVGITVDWNGSSYVMNDNSLLIGVFDNYGGGSTYQASSGSSTFGNNIFYPHSIFGSRNTSNADTYRGTSQSLSFMYWVLGRDFVDGARGPRYYTSVTCCQTLITARNHVNSNYVNAYWNGNSINIGDGDNSLSGPLSTLDIIGHEWTHGLTQYTAGLIYSGESGAINESFSDILGAMTERYWKGESSNTWKIGEEAWTPGTAGDALRYMDAPWLAGHPWHYSQRYTGTADNGGVHSNSGISNFAFYVLAKGWPGSGVSGIGADAARYIFYKALSECMIPSDGFYWTRQCTEWKASQYYGFGSFAYNQTVLAWRFVGAPGNHLP